LATLTLTGEAPATVTLVGIIPADLGLGLELSPAVAGVVGQAVECLAAELRGLGYPLELKLQTLPS
ncbi:MAG TPA: hydrogenase maturation protease, partial [Candidatus Paceibacterota bacterium]|nr:hydrogenase maturation protease [Candidatus Paceibacterota bacterium]